ncbi:T-cell antigen CD7 isoform X1 [Theropithecus gelada]|uniref:T-cell antigen CD7 isoform X1 n=1 Tax=Theropithecus gelada TaxID=9565 RepID=UPI000DC1BD43|nr:T-cell antigen CD7 isoform X1 [Theropithecus gelada]
MAGPPRLLLLPLLLALARGLPGALAAQEVQQSPHCTIAPVGGSVNITCSTSGGLHGIYLRQLGPQPQDIIYYEDRVVPTTDKRFQGRIDFSGSQDNLTITMHHLQPSDTGTYTCQAVTEVNVYGSSTLVLVTEEQSQGLHRCSDAPPTGSALPVPPTTSALPALPTASALPALPTASALPVALAVVSFLLGLALGVACVLARTQVSVSPRCHLHPHRWFPLLRAVWRAPKPQRKAPVPAASFAGPGALRVEVALAGREGNQHQRDPRGRERPRCWSRVCTCAHVQV